MSTASIAAIATTPAFRNRSGAPPESSLPAVTHDPTISSSLDTRPDGSSGAARAAARSGTTARTSQGRAPCAAQPSASAHPSGTSTRAIQVRTAALAEETPIAAMVSTSDRGATSDQPRPCSRSRNPGIPTEGSATQSACARSSTSLSESKYIGTAACQSARWILGLEPTVVATIRRRSAPCEADAAARRARQEVLSCGTALATVCRFSGGSAEDGAIALGDRTGLEHFGVDPGAGLVDAADGLQELRPGSELGLGVADHDAAHGALDDAQLDRADVQCAPEPRVLGERRGVLRVEQEVGSQPLDGHAFAEQLGERG